MDWNKRQRIRDFVFTGFTESSLREEMSIDSRMGDWKKNTHQAKSYKTTEEVYAKSWHVKKKSEISWINCEENVARKKQFRITELRDKESTVKDKNQNQTTCSGEKLTS